eukprot:COSAG01_NODE_62285_length_285_cov_1.037634_1_plen_32_part_10
MGNQYSYQGTEGAARCCQRCLSVQGVSTSGTH